MTTTQRAAHARGILLMVIAVGVFAAMDALMKRLTAHYPPLQVASLRGASSLPFVLVPLLLTGRLHLLRPVRVSLHLLRGALAIGMLWGFIWALGRASMADTYAVFMCAPLLVVLAASIGLGERVDMHHWAAIAVGLLGVVVILNPSVAGFTSLAGLAALGAALAYAWAVVTVRILARTDTTPAMVFWFLLFVALGAGALAAPDWVAIRGSDWSWIAAVGLLGWMGQHLITEAFRLAPASLVAPFEYTGLVWALGIDLVVWQTLPSARMLAGATIVVASGLYLLRRQRAAPKP